MQARDILKFAKDRYSSFDKVDLIWASPPCPVFSYAAGNFHFFDGKPKTAEAIESIKLLKKSCVLIQDLAPEIYFIENPRGRMRYQKEMIDFLVKNNGMIKELTYASYGFPTTKPTNLFTNAYDFVPRALWGYGRGNKSPEQIFNNLTVCQRQRVPGSLCEDIMKYAETKLTGPLRSGHKIAIGA